jgi:hypothetical protein
VIDAPNIILSANTDKPDPALQEFLRLHEEAIELANSNDSPLPHWADDRKETELPTNI